VLLSGRVRLYMCLSVAQHVLCLFLVSLSIIVTEQRIMAGARDLTDNARE
jgi:hypothetical protein